MSAGLAVSLAILGLANLIALFVNEDGQKLLIIDRDITVGRLIVVVLLFLPTCVFWTFVSTKPFECFCKSFMRAMRSQPFKKNK